MKKYYTRACNFFYGSDSIKLIKKKLTLPLCGENNISFNKIEIFIRDKKKVESKIMMSPYPIFLMDIGILPDLKKETNTQYI